MKTEKPVNLNSMPYGRLRLIMAVALVIIPIIALIPVMPIRVIPASAPQSEFSAERAMYDLKVIAQNLTPWEALPRKK
jgi:hypothetical protein